MAPLPFLIRDVLRLRQGLAGYLLRDGDNTSGTNGNGGTRGEGHELLALRTTMPRFAAP